MPAAVPPEAPAVAAVEEETQSYSWQESAVAEEAPANAEEGVEFGLALQLAQILGVGRRDVDRDVAGERVGTAQADQVVVDRTLGRRGRVQAG